MSALALEEEMAVEDRVAKLESNVAHLRTDVAEIKVDLKDLRQDLNSFKVQIATQVGAFQTEVAKEFGFLRVQVERNKWWMLAIGVATILSLLATAATLVRSLKL